MSVHHAASDERRHIAHTAPRVSCRALEPEIVPGVLAAWRIRRHHCEGMQYNGEIELGGCGVERLQCWMVERHASRRVDHQPPSPFRFTPAVDLAERSVNVAGARQYDAAEPVWITAAIVGHPAVIGSVYRHFERHVV